MISSSLSEEGLSAGEPVDQVEGPLGLVIRHHMSRIPHLCKKTNCQNVQAIDLVGDL